MMNQLGKFSSIPMFLDKSNLVIDFIDEANQWIFAGPTLSPTLKPKLLKFLTENQLLPCTVSPNSSEQTPFSEASVCNNLFTELMLRDQISSLMP